MIWLTTLGLGTLLVWTLQAAGLIQPIFSIHPKLKELRDCDFCLGFWVFLPFVFLFDLNLMAPFYLPVFSEVATAIAISFAVHIFRLGWTHKFGYFTLDDEE